MEARIKLASCVQDIPNAILNPAFNHDVAKARLAFRDMRKSIFSIIEPLMAAQKRKVKVLVLNLLYILY